jgi:soluble lytic murein transglycosylase-like protein
MKNRLFAGIFAAALLALTMTIPAEARCSDNGACFGGKKTTAVTHKTPSSKVAAHKTRKSSAARKPSKKRVHRKAGARKTHASSHAAPAQSGRVVSLIKAMAPSYGVPTWFALRIAKVESNYNPNLRGRAGEYGVFQLKCATAKGIGFSGNCAALLDPAINVRWGLKHLSLAMTKSGGNLRLAASMHNGGLGRKTEIPGYVRKIF